MVYNTSENQRLSRRMSIYFYTQILLFVNHEKISTEEAQQPTVGLKTNSAKDLTYR